MGAREGTKVTCMCGCVDGLKGTEQEGKGGKDGRGGTFGPRGGGSHR